MLAENISIAAIQETPPPRTISAASRHGGAAATSYLHAAVARTLIKDFVNAKERIHCCVNMVQWRQILLSL